MEKQNEMQIFVGKEILNIKSSKGYIELRNELYKNHNIDKNKQSILCIDLKNKFIIDGEESFTQWKINRQLLGNVFLILGEHKIKKDENINNLQKKIKVSNMIEDFENLDKNLKDKKNEIEMLEEIIKQEVKDL